MVFRGISLWNTPPTGFDAEAQRCDVEKKNLVDFTHQSGALQRGTHGNDLIGVDAFVGRLSKEVRDLGLHHGHTALATHQQDLVDVFFADARVFQGLLTGAEGLIDDRGNQDLQLAPLEPCLEMLRAGLVRCDERKIDLRFERRRKLVLRLLGLLFETLKGDAVFAQVDPAALFEATSELLDQCIV